MRLLSNCARIRTRAAHRAPSQLPELYRRRVETLEEALRDPEGASAAARALRSLIDAVVFYPEEGRGKYRLELRGDLAAFLYLTDADTQKVRAISGTGLVCSDVKVIVGCGGTQPPRVNYAECRLLTGPDIHLRQSWRHSPYCRRSGTIIWHSKAFIRSADLARISHQILIELYA